MNGVKVLLYGDVAIPSGFGRIGGYTGRYLHQRGYLVSAACLQYDGLLPHGAPFWVSGLAGRDAIQAISGIWSAVRPDVVVSLQDFPYHEMLRGASGIDWSVTAHVVITPIDGVPINEDWLQLAPQLDALMTISEFGVEAFRQNGVRAELCPPGVDTQEFNRLPDPVRADLRSKLGIPADAFVVGMFAMNQGRKDFPAMVEGFAEAFRDVPNAYLYLDCERVNLGGGWDIPKQLMKPLKLKADRVRFREDAHRAGIRSLNDRYNLIDLHAVIAHREGFGLPHIEAMATGVPTTAIDYCSGREIVGANEERGLLIQCHPGRLGTWGGAQDFNADIQDLAQKLRMMYENPAERAVRGQRALEYAQARTWDKAGAAVEAAIQRVLVERGMVAHA